MEKKDNLESQNQGSCKPRPRGSRTAIGLIIVLIGSAFIIRNAFPGTLPSWLFTWPMILIIWGTIIGLRNRFKDVFSSVVILIGAAFLLRNIYDLPWNLGPYIWPAIIVVIGLIIMLKPRSKRDWKKRWETNSGGKKKDWEVFSDNPVEEKTEDYIDSVAVFTGSRKAILSKSFKGGEMVTVFGGSEINLTQADMDAPATLDVVVAFGGMKLVVPPHWEVRANVVNFAAGVDDKRSFPPSMQEQTKILILSGTVMFGGIEIKSY